MLYVPEAIQEKLRSLGKQVKTGDPAELARQMLDAWPEWPQAWILIAANSKDQQEGEAAYRKALELGPCRAEFYLAYGDVRTQRNEADVLAKRLRHLGLWKLALAEEVRPGMAEAFKPVLGDRASEPEAYEIVARLEDRQLEGVVDPPEVIERLRPFRLLNDLQREAPDALAQDTLQSILGHSSECAPLFRSALHQWAREEDVLDDRGLRLLIAFLGEISGPDFVDDLLELTNTSDKALFLHVHWAIHRLGERHPDAVLERFQAAARNASIGLRCALADQLLLLDGVRDEEAQLTLLVSLLDGLEQFAASENAAYLLASVAFTLAERERGDLEKSVIQRYQKALTREGREWLRDARKADSDFLPVLVEEEIEGVSLENVCIDRVLMEDELDETEEDEEEFPEEEFDEPLDLEPPLPKPGRNDPCWCGSGKKYKKCHLSADESAQREVPETKSVASPSGDLSLQSSLTHDVFETAMDWLIKKDGQRTKELFFGTRQTVQATEDRINRYIQWMLHDFRDSISHRTPFEYYLQVRGKKLTAQERTILESLRDARYGLLEIECVEQGSGIHVHDLGTDDRFFVHDVSSSNSLVRWDALLARAQFLEGRWIFAGDGMVVPRRLLDRLLRMIDEEAGMAGQSRAEFLRSNSHRMERMVQGLHQEFVAGIKVVNNENEDVEFGRSEYGVQDQPALLTLFRSIEELREDTADNADTHGFSWLQPMGDILRPLGHVEIGGGRLILEAQSRTRLQTLRGLVESHAGRLLTHRGDTYESVGDILRNAPERSSRPESAVPSEAEREALLGWKTAHYQKWPDDPLPALGGKTARQAVRNAGGRTAVRDLLRMMENGEEKERKSGRPAYDFNILRRQLGLPEE
jgi:hypothetical protein